MTTKGIFAAGAVWLLSLAAYSAESVMQKAEQDKLSFVSEDDPAMLRAFEKARATLDGFLSKAERPSYGESGFALKVGISKGKQTEYFWVDPFTRKGDEFVGTIQNNGEMVKNIRVGQRYKFKRADIFDWLYTESSSTRRKMKGNFTACALLTHEPPDEAAEFRKAYGLDCD